MFTADAHCDTLYSIAVEGRAADECKVTKEALRKGNVGIQTFALFAGGEGPAGHPYEKAQSMLAAMDKVGVPFYLGKLPEEAPTEPHGVLSIEGGEIFTGSLERLREMCGQYAIRLVALTWNNENEIGYPGAGTANLPLKPFGRALLREMDALGVLADVSHLNEAGFWDCIEGTTRPTVASHSNLRKLCDVHRNLTDEQAKAIIAKKGFIGVNFYSAFLRADGEATIEDVYRHIDAIAEMGGIDCVGLGSDFDGIERWPEGLASPSDVPALLDGLSRRGYTEAQVRGIAGGNYWRVLRG